MRTSTRSRPARRPRLVPHVADPCPLCSADLGGAGSVTRRQVFYTAERGAFGWRCPECGGTWQERPEPAASLRRRVRGAPGAGRPAPAPGGHVSEQPGGDADDQTRTADEERAASLPDDSHLTPGLAAHTVDPVTRESHTGQ